MSQIPIGWLINRGVCLPLEQQVSMMIDGINQLPAPLFLPKGHYCGQQPFTDFNWDGSFLFHHLLGVATMHGPYIRLMICPSDFCCFWVVNFHMVTLQ